MRNHITGGFELLLCRRGLSGVGRVADLVVELTNTERILLSDEILEGMEGEGGTTVDRPSSVLWAGMITTELIRIINKLRSNFLLHVTPVCQRLYRFLDLAARRRIFPEGSICLNFRKLVHE